MKPAWLTGVKEVGLAPGPWPLKPQGCPFFTCFQIHGLLGAMPDPNATSIHIPKRHLPKAVTYHGLEVHKVARGAVEELWRKPALLPTAVPNCVALRTEAWSYYGWTPSDT